jgi:hypothetical protein
MSEHTIALEWSRNTPDFTYDTYSRSHAITMLHERAHSGCIIANFNAGCVTMVINSTLKQAQDHK